MVYGHHRGFWVNLGMYRPIKTCESQFVLPLNVCIYATTYNDDDDDDDYDDDDDDDDDDDYDDDELFLRNG